MPISSYDNKGGDGGDGATSRKEGVGGNKDSKNKSEIKKRTCTDNGTTAKDKCHENKNTRKTQLLSTSSKRRIINKPLRYCDNDDRHASPTDKNKSKSQSSFSSKRRIISCRVNGTN